MEERYEYWFACIEGIGNQKKRILREHFGCAQQLYYIEETKLEKEQILSEKEMTAFNNAREKWKLSEEYQKLSQGEIRFIPYFSEEYPKKLEELPQMPYALFVRGKLPPEGKKYAAIVGARKCSEYGEQMALLFAQRLAEAGIDIVSGMARGIDGAGHRGALNGGGATYAVLGCGADVCYPKEHKGLYRDILKRGGIISEYSPGTSPLPMYFPARNRIISGLSDLVLVIEARHRSGSLITADMALEQGRDVYALPGPVTSALSRGCLELIKQGAGVLISPENLLEELKISYKISEEDSGKKVMKNKIMLERTENLVYSSVCLYPKSREQIIKETGLGAPEAAGILVSLVLKGYIKEVSKNYYVKAELK